jgi:DNA (cytosine-5)-methyltransferase 1
VKLKFGSVCSGIEAASVAWAPLGWEAAWFSEIEPFPSKVLAHRFPEVPNLGDMTKLPDMIRAGLVEAPDVLCGGTPCQAFSVAGLRNSLNDARGNLTLTFVEIANALDARRRELGLEPTVLFWENVPGVLNTPDNAFGCFLGALAGEDAALEPAGGKWSHAGCVFGPERAIAWRVLDAQHFGVAQRRKRVYVVACPLERAHPTAILFEFESGRRDSEPCRPAGQEVAASLTGSSGGVDENDAAGGLLQPYAVANCLTQRMHKGINTTLDEGQTPILAYSTKLHNTKSNQAGKLYPEYTVGLDACSPPPAVMAYRVAGDGAAYETEEHTAPLTTGTDKVAQLVYVKGTNPHSEEEAPTFRETETAGCLTGWDERHNPPKHLVAYTVQVRKLLPVECERLQAFPDFWTDIPGASDTARYKALGNSWATVVVTWIGRRIQENLR